MRATLPSLLLLTSSIIYVFFSLGHFLAWANNDEERLPPFPKNSHFAPNANGTDSPANDSQNMFQSSISCGQSEFYVQINFNSPFKGLLYAYRNMRPDDSIPSLHYPVQILDTCTLRGNGASVVYLELSFFSECVEPLFAFAAPVVDDTTNSPSDDVPTNTTATPIFASQTATSNSKYNLDGFHFRRALDSSAQLKNLSNEQTYQLSLYIQNDANIEQKTDSKVTIQCSAQLTRNIVFEQNSAADYSRRVDSAYSSPSKNRTLIPHASLVVDTHPLNQTLTSEPSARIDILRGRVPFVKLIDSRVELGDDLTVIIRAKMTKPDGFEWRVSQCYAHEGNNTVRHELTNQQGCPVDSNLMPSFKVLHQPSTEYSQVFYTSFAAFKFPDSSHLHIDCRLLLCHKPCPKVASCENANPATRAPGTQPSHFHV